MGLKIINNVVKTSSKRSKTTQNTTNTQENLSQVEYDKSTSKIESSAESEYVTDSDFEPATEDEVENTILDCDVEKTKFSKETPSSLMEKVIFFQQRYYIHILSQVCTYQTYTYFDISIPLVSVGP